ncbi:hypothetical protein BABINDRAFT_159267 [Babjeviella inositovora NRRL Y-12698]|uniref:Uncharacterized protein n=1 Tax=Babjeviella inositovora NRRL Y-12698 TaxID=984486 RepID=A0A1E3R064_9ASCO|nr:uncharacterized protein BABINDRAFT_159267 [Babjeviella inositovora NRRL Y-12698]ODQ82752.1 hypothetical protein BABINDRAFT_159267 [Babjeviella inositovora NRRL Y-12698]
MWNVLCRPPGSQVIECVGYVYPTKIETNKSFPALVSCTVYGFSEFLPCGLTSRSRVQDFDGGTDIRTVSERHPQWPDLLSNSNHKIPRIAQCEKQSRTNASEVDFSREGYEIH